MDYFCKKCNKQYASYQSFWNHNNSFHKDNKENKGKSKVYVCKNCLCEFTNRQTKWRHEKTCKKENETVILKSKIEQIEKDVEKLKTEPKIITNNTTNNTTNNIQYIINPPTASSTNHLTFELQTDILDKGLNSLAYLIEVINFNKSVPENHSYCVTAINDKHATVIDEKTNKVIKTDKIDLFDKILIANLNTLEKISKNPQFSQEQHDKYNEKINYLRNMIFQNEKFMKRYQNDINILSYNNKNMIKNTWKNLKEINIEQEIYKVQGFDDLVEELNKEDNSKKGTKKIDEYNSSDSELSDDSDTESEHDTDLLKIEYNKKTYYLDNNMLFENNNGKKGKIFANYKNGKVVVIKKKEIDV